MIGREKRVYDSSFVLPTSRCLVTRQPGEVSDHDRVATARGPIGPVMQFALLIVPIVMSGFFLVYALTGWILEGRDRLNWALEAEFVAVWVGLGIVAYSLLVSCWVWLKGGARWHPLIVSSIGHVVLTLLLVISVFITTRL